VKVKGASLSEGEVTVVSRTNLLPGKFLLIIVLLFGDKKNI